MKYVFLRYIELILTTIGLLIIFAFIAWLPDSLENKWFIVSWVSLVIGGLHGFIFFAVRNRQRRVREEAIHEVAMMLQDLINNKMTVIRNYAGSDDSGLRKISDDAVLNVTGIVNSLSEESLSSWKSRYKDMDFWKKQAR